jgi:pimeloyl-ACP methyl ester carboxylesterase
MIHTVDERKIAYWLIDLVPPWKRENLQTVVFHHGLAVHPEQWLEWLPRLINNYRILLFDMFGTGRSSLDGSDRDWTIEARMRDMWSLADHLRLGKFHFVGESYGGTIGLSAGLAEPERFASLTIVNASHHGARITNTDWYDKTIDTQGVAAWSDNLMIGRFFQDNLSDGQRAWYSDQQRKHSAASVKYTMKELRRADLSERISDLTLPVLLIHSDASPFIDVGVVADMHKRIKDSELQIFAHTKHGVPFSHGDKGSQVLSEFIERLRSRAAGKKEVGVWE